LQSDLGFLGRAIKKLRTSNRLLVSSSLVLLQPVSTRPEEIKQDAEKQLVDLIVRVAATDQTALSQLYDITSSTLFGLILRIVRQPEAAEEVTLEVRHRQQRVERLSDRCVSRRFVLDGRHA